MNFIYIFLTILFVGCIISCNGDKKYYYDTNDALVRYQEIEQTTFTLTGSTTCGTCRTRSLNVSAVQIEVVPEADPLTTIVVNTFGGLCPFSFREIKYYSKAKLTIYGKLYYNNGDDFIEASTDVTVPDNDGNVISCVLDF